MDMAIIYTTRADAVRDIDALLQKAAAGAEIVIESETEPTVVLRSANDETVEAAHAEWVRSRVQEALDDPRPSIPHEEVKARIDKKFADARRKELEATI